MHLFPAAPQQPTYSFQIKLSFNKHTRLNLFRLFIQTHYANIFAIAYYFFYFSHYKPCFYIKKTDEIKMEKIVSFINILTLFFTTKDIFIREAATK